MRVAGRQRGGDERRKDLLLRPACPGSQGRAKFLKGEEAWSTDSHLARPEKDRRRLSRVRPPVGQKEVFWQTWRPSVVQQASTEEPTPPRFSV